MNKRILLFLGFVLLITEGLRAQACMANAGLIHLPRSIYCVGDTIRPEINNAQDNPNYSNELIIVDSLGLIVQVGITTGEITNLAFGQYGIHAFNYRRTNPPMDGPKIGQSITDIQNPESNCYDISTLASIQITDTIAPTAVCMEQPIYLYLDREGEASIAPSELDFGSFDEGCIGIDTLYSNQEIFTCQSAEDLRITLYVQDSVGLLDSCTTELRIRDTIPPTIHCQSAIMYLDENGQAPIDPSALIKDSSDNCGDLLEFTSSRSVVTCEDIGESSIYLRARDEQNNVDSCEVVITVRDTISPEPSCQNVTVFAGENGLAVLSAQDVDDESIDICTGIERKYLSKNRFTCGESGQNQVQLYLEDQFGNVDSCSAIITVVDTLPPQSSCENRTIFLDESGNSSLTVAMVDNGSTDNCGRLGSIELSRYDFDCSVIGQNEVSLMVSDRFQNRDSCTSQITVLDTIAPQARCKNYQLALGTDGLAILTADLINQRSTDNCAIQEFSLDKSNFSCLDLGDNKVVLRVEDQSGNRDSCESVVTVVDLNKPQVMTQNIEAILEEDGLLTVLPDQIDAGSLDNCGIDSMWLSQGAFDCSHIGPNLIRLYVRDTDGNINDKAAVVEVLDVSKPRFSCPEFVRLESSLDGAGDCFLVVPDDRLDPGGLMDNCGIDTVYHNYETAVVKTTLQGASFSLGTSKVSWTIIDKNGQQAFCHFEVEVVDTEPPVALCKDSLLVELDDQGLVQVEQSWIDMGSTDNCEIVRVELSKTIFDCDEVGFNQIQVEMFDAAGNSGTCNVMVGIKASSNCKPPQLTNAGGPDIADPCTCRGEGAFDEQVVIGPTTNHQTWTVKSTSLRSPQSLEPITSGTAFVEIPTNQDSSIYVLRGVHLDGEGYTLTAESPFFADLSLSNRCYYPAPKLLNLEGPICLFTNPIPLEVMLPIQVDGSGYFTINGEPSRELKPLELGVGTHLLTYHFDAGNPATLLSPSNSGCTVELEKTITIIETNPAITCNDKINVTSNVSCETLINPEMVLSGDFLCFDDYQVFLGFDGQAIPNPVPAEYAGKTLDAVVQHKVTGHICSSEISIMDVTGPRISQCPPEIRDRFICSDLDSIINNPASLDEQSKFYTGSPQVEDNCTGTLIDFQDHLLLGDGCTSNLSTTLRRVFRVADQFGNTNSCEQLITFRKPENVFFPADTLVKIDCHTPDLATNQEGNLAPSIAGAPFVINGFGEAVSLDDHPICGYLLVYEDQKATICASKEGVLRTWRLFDECAGSITKSSTQYIQYGDFTPPVITCPALDLDHNGKIDPLPTYSTSAFDCLATITLPMPVVEECSEYTVDTRVYTWQTRDRFGFPLPEPFFTELKNVEYINGQIRGVPVGDHYLVYTVRDICNNLSRDTCQFRVKDGIAPVALCKEELVIALSNSGTQVLPVDIDAGSRDNCDDTRLDMEIRRLVPTECSAEESSYYSNWGAGAELTCCDVDKLVTVELRITDQSGNQNRCVSRIKVKDNIEPSCRAPFNVRVNCDDLRSGFDPANVQDLQNSFGTPVIRDNCEASWRENSPQVRLDQCGVGTITRTFQVVDRSGNLATTTCQQTIKVDPVYDYTIKFPADTEQLCGSINQDTVEVREKACDMLGISITDSEFRPSGEGCFQIERVYRVINWCEYDGMASPVKVPRHLNCDQIPGGQDTWVHVSKNDTTYFDQNDNPFDDLPAVNGLEGDCQVASHPKGHWLNSGIDQRISSVGFWQYTQFIRITDESAPIVHLSAPSKICSQNNTCMAEVVIPFTLSENCTSDQLSLTGTVDLGDDGLSDYELLREQINGTYPNYSIKGDFDLGKHRVYLRVTDACHNEALADLAFEVVDCMVPSPSCNENLVVALDRLEQPIDMDGDGEVDLASANVSVASLLADSTSDCSGPIVFSLNRPGRVPQRDQQSLQLTCEDEGILQVEVHAWDSLGNSDFCTTFIDVQNNTNACQELPRGSIGGRVLTETTIPIQSVEVSLSGAVRIQKITNREGQYTFSELMEGDDFTVIPRMEGNDRLGLTTFDLVLIRKHILGVSLLDSPYKIIAADLNNSGNISILDMILLQRLILGVEDSLPGNNSWRFVDASYIFPDPSHPFLEAFPSVININNLDGSFNDANFIGIKMGDVNNSAHPGNIKSVNARSKSQLVFVDMEEQEWEAGSRVEIPVRLAKASHLAGFQFGLVYDRSKLELDTVIAGQLSPQDIAYFSESGRINCSWYRRRKPLDSDEPVFYLRFRVLASDHTSNFISLDPKQLKPEAYTKSGIHLPLSLRFPNHKVPERTSFLLQNWPNPADSETTISWYLPQSTRGELQLMNGKGEVIWQLAGKYEAGWNRYRLSTGNFPPGVLYYRFASKDFSASRKMILIHR